MWWTGHKISLLLFIALFSWVQCCQEGQLTEVLETCEEYNVCENGLLVRKRCDIGKYFNGLKCDHFWKIECNKRPCINGMVYPRGVCANDYDVCFNGKLQRELCPTLFRFDGETCVPMDTCKNKNIENRCIDGDVSNIDGISYMICVNGEYQTKYCPLGRIFRKLTKTCEPVTINLKDEKYCEENDRRPLKDCSTYEECIKGHYETKKCSDGMLFDKDYLMCRFSYEAKCADDSCEQGKLSPNLDDCSSYYVCKDGKEKGYSCGYFQYFDPVSSECTYHKQCDRNTCTGEWTKVSSDCSDYTICKNGYQITYSCPWLQKYKDGSCSLFNSCEQPNMMILKSQANECVPGTKQRIPGRCTDYLQCNNQKKWKTMKCDPSTNFQKDNCENKPCPLSPILNRCSKYKDSIEGGKEFECKFGYRFDKIQNECVHFAAATCARGECVTHEKTYYPGDCHRYKECNDKGTWEVKTCSWIFRHYNWHTKECKFLSSGCKLTQSDVKDKAKIAKDANIRGVKLWYDSKCTEGEKKLIENTCRWYTECENGRLETKKCSPCQNFNAVEKKCDWVWKKPCDTGVTDPPEMTTSPPEPSTTEPPITTIKRVCDQDGDKQGVPGDCNKYNECVQGQWVLKNCKVWGKFDINTKTCCYWAPWSAKCA